LAGPGRTGQNETGVRKAIFLFVFAGVVFRSEIALLLVTQLLVLLLQSKVSLKTIISAGITSAVVALTISVPIDSYFWQKPLWPELWGFYYNAILGKSTDWGTSPWHAYFTSMLPKLLLNPAILLLVPLAFTIPSTKTPSLNLTLPSLLFIAIYSLQPHKEARFIIYAVPPLTAAASLSAFYIWNRRSKSLLYAFGSLLLFAFIAASCLASTSMLLISSLNYPGGEALTSLHAILQRTPNQPGNITVHMDVLPCMTGVTRFLQLRSPSTINGRTTIMKYDKTEDAETLLDPAFWDSMDYALMEDSSKAIGDWDVVDTIYAYSGIEFLRPGDGSSFSENMERIYAANNITDGQAPEGREVRDVEAGAKKENVEDLKARLLLEEMGRFGTFNLLRDGVRSVTGGWWVGPRMEPKIKVLRRVRGHEA
jgi:alpha-1,6-mannosyltransferase